MAIVKMAFALCFLMFLVISDVTAMEMGIRSDLLASSVTAMYVLGDSSVDCGGDSPFHAFLHQNFSLLPCNGSDTSLLPQLLGTLSLSLSLKIDF